MEWVVLLPVKATGRAKSRLAPAFGDPRRLATVVAAMRSDTVSAVRAAVGVVGLVAVVDGPTSADSLGIGTGVDVVVQQAPGLNAALVEADSVAAGRYPGAGRIAVVGDLPALTPVVFAAVLAAAERHPRAYVADLAGSGTTMLAVTEGPLDPRFGPGSALRHGADAVALTAGVAARYDVDVPADLRTPLAAGFGAATRRALAAAC